MQIICQFSMSWPSGKMNILWMVVALSWLSQASGSNMYDGFKVYKVSRKSRSAGVSLDFFELAKNESFYEFLSDEHILVHPDAQPEFNQLLNEHVSTYQVLKHDVGSTLRQQFETHRKLRRELPYQGKLGTQRYYTHDEINQYIEKLAQKYPTRVEVKTVGKSYKGRWLKTIRITNGDGRPNKNVILMDGGFHGREWISPAAVIYAIGELVDNHKAYAELLLDYDWVILPVVNPDGYKYSQQSADTRLWRKTRQPTTKNCIGTDPNRNFDFHWRESGASAEPCSNTYAGPKAFSEPETVVMRDLIHSLADRGKMYLTVHSFGKHIVYPWGYIDELPDTWEDLDEVGRAGGDAIRAATGTVYKVGSSTKLIYPAAGASDDYAFNAGFPISFTMELPGGGSLGFNPPASEVDRLVKETWIGIKAMARKVVEKYPLK